MYFSSRNYCKSQKIVPRLYKTKESPSNIEMISFYSSVRFLTKLNEVYPKTLPLPTHTGGATLNNVGWSRGTNRKAIQRFYSCGPISNVFVIFYWAGRAMTHYCLVVAPPPSTGMRDGKYCVSKVSVQGLDFHGFGCSGAFLGFHNN